MLTYEYKCTACGRTFEFRQSITDKPLSECPECRGRIHRIISGGSGFILKQDSNGSGRNACSLNSSGTTCCGLGEPCGNPPCDTTK